MTTKMIIQGNILEPEQFRKTPIGVMERISSIIGSTLGPGGSNVCIYDDMEGKHKVTKDGYRILKSIGFPDSVAQMVLDTIRGVVRSVIVNVGDGSTSTVVLSSHLMNELTKIYEGKVKKGKYTPRVFMMIQSKIVECLVERIKKNARSVLKHEGDVQVIDNDLMRTITIHAANNDEKVGGMIADTLHLPTDRIAIEYGNAMQQETTIDTYSGYRFPRGYAHEGFIRKEDFENGRYVVEIEEGMSNNPSGINVLVASGRKVDDTFFNNIIMPVLALNTNLKQACMIVVPEVSTPMRDLILKLAQESGLHNILLLDYRYNNERDIRWVRDLALYCGAKVVDIHGKYPIIKDRQNLKKEEIEKVQDLLGSVDALRSTSTETVLRKKDVDQMAIQERIAKITLEMKNVSENANGEELQEIVHHKRSRIESLSGKQSKIIVGGATPQAKQHTHDLIDDATLAAYSAIESGIVPGAGYNVASILLKEWENFLIDVMKDMDNSYEDLAVDILGAYANSYLQYIHTLINNGNEEEEYDIEYVRDLVNNGNIVDIVHSNEIVPAESMAVAYPAATDIEILRGVSSIVGLYLSSDYVVVPA